MHIYTNQNRDEILFISTVASSQVHFLERKASRCKQMENRNVKKDGEMMGVDMFLIDVKATLIQSSINYHRLNTFKHLLNECSLYELIVL
ncbi:hypothetical protein YC2023_087641 [Brassica napus]